LFDRSLRWGVLTYAVSLTPLLRFTTGDQALNQLDLIFPAVVWVGLVWLLVRRQRDDRAGYVP
jgi:hypothetical protein